MSPAQRRQMVDREHPNLPIVQQCALLGVSRSSLYYRPRDASAEDLSLMGEIDRQYLEPPFYGSRRMRAWLERQGMPVSRKRVQRLMRAMGLWAIYQRPSTSRHLDSIERFLTDTSDWAMPSIILAVAPGAISETRNTIEVSPDQLQVLDGQHRIQAFYNVIHGWEMDAPRDESNGIQEKLDQISKEELPVVIMEVRDKKDQRQIFAWFARNKPIEPAVREFFDLASGEHREPRTGPPAGNRTIRQP